MLNYIKSLLNNKTNTVVDSDLHDLCVVWIHGANQTSLSFEYLRERTKFKNEILINYSSMNSFYDNLNNMIETISPDQPVFLVGHSLGGIYALHLTEHCNVLGVVSISTPYRGSSAADWAKYVVPGYQLFKDVGRRSKPILFGHKIQINIPYTQVVSTTGSVPYLSSPNDGVVTVSSMTCRTDMEYIEVPHTHYEVMCSNTVADIVSERYKKIV